MRSSSGAVSRESIVLHADHGWIFFILPGYIPELKIYGGYFESIHQLPYRGQMPNRKETVKCVKLNNYCTMYYCSLIYELCLHKHACFFVSTATSWNSSASLEIFLPYQAVYQYLLDNPVSGLSFVPTVIAALHPSNRMITWSLK